MMVVRYRWAKIRAWNVRAPANDWRVLRKLAQFCNVPFRSRFERLANAVHGVVKSDMSRKCPANVFWAKDFMRTVRNSILIIVRRPVRARTERLCVAVTHVLYWNVHPNNSKLATIAVCIVRKLHRSSQRAVMAARTIRWVLFILCGLLTVFFDSSFWQIKDKFLKNNVFLNIAIFIFCFSLNLLICQIVLLTEFIKLLHDSNFQNIIIHCFGNSACMVFSWTTHGTLVRASHVFVNRAEIDALRRIVKSRDANRMNRW